MPPPVPAGERRWRGRVRSVIIHAVNLTDLGLTPEQADLYRFLLGRRGEAAEAATAAAPDAVLRGLVELGLIGADGAAVAPATATDLLIRQRIDQATREVQQLGSAWDLLRELDGAVGADRPVELVERVEGAAAVNRRIFEFRARKETLAMQPGSGSRRPKTVDIADYRRRLAAGLTGRTIVSRATLAVPGRLEYSREQHRLGDLHRVAEGPFQRMVILDRRVAFVAADPGEAVAALVIRQKGAVATLVELFEHAWRRARDLDAEALTEFEREVLHALASEAKDESAARSLNVSVRKYRGHVADLMGRVGAVNRFQFALRAKENGWF